MPQISKFTLFLLFFFKPVSEKKLFRMIFASISWEVLWHLRKPAKSGGKTGGKNGQRQSSGFDPNGQKYPGLSTNERESERNKLTYSGIVVEVKWLQLSLISTI